MNTESLFPGMLIYKVQLKFKDHLVLVHSLKMAVDRMKKPPLLHFIKKQQKRPKIGKYS